VGPSHISGRRPHDRSVRDLSWPSLYRGLGRSRASRVPGRALRPLQNALFRSLRLGQRMGRRSRSVGTYPQPARRGSHLCILAPCSRLQECPSFVPQELEATIPASCPKKGRLTCRCSGLASLAAELQLLGALGRAQTRNASHVACTHRARTARRNPSVNTARSAARANLGLCGSCARTS
jgi:hypothetical protein